MTHRTYCRSHAVQQRLNMRLPAGRIRALSRLQETAIENGAVGGDDEHDLFQQIVDGSKSVIRTLAVRIGPAGITTFGGS